MSALMAIAPASLFDLVVDGEPTLDELIVGRWEALAVHRSVQCPVCGGSMRPAYGQHAPPQGGRCESCGSTLG